MHDHERINVGFRFAPMLLSPRPQSSAPVGIGTRWRSMRKGSPMVRGFRIPPKSWSMHTRPHWNMYRNASLEFTRIHLTLYMYPSCKRQPSSSSYLNAGPSSRFSFSMLPPQASSKKRVKAFQRRHLFVPPSHATHVSDFPPSTPGCLKPRKTIAGGESSTPAPRHRPPT
jgi:hypothetical protein